MEGYSQADILAALQRQSTAPPPPTKQYKDVERDELHQGDKKVNTRKLYCPREGCRAVIVQPGTCELVEGKTDVVSGVLVGWGSRPHAPAGSA